MLPERIVVLALAGAVGAALANRGIAIFHDGLRSLMPEVMEGRLPAGELAPAAFGLSFGLLVGFGFPYSLISLIAITHVLWLGTDLIGTRFPSSFDRDGRLGRRSLLRLVGAAGAGAVYGGLLAVGLAGAVDLFARLPVNIVDAMGELGAPIIFTFIAFPALAVAYQHGLRSGAITLLLTLIVRQVAGALGWPNPDGWGLAAGMLLLVLLALGERQVQDGNVLSAVRPGRARRIRRALPALALLGAVYGLASNLAIMMEGPQSLVALAQGDRTAAVNIAVARALAYTPLKTMSALSTGLFAMDGLGLVPAVGLIAPNAAVAALAGALVMSLEALSLALLANGLEKLPGLRKAADNIRTAMTKLLEVGALVGSMMAANRMAPAAGLAAVAGLYLLNETAGTPIVRVAAAPLAAILVGLAVNVLILLHVYVPLT